MGTLPALSRHQKPLTTLVAPPSHRKPETRSPTTTTRAVAVVVSFFICWVPFHAQRLLASYLVKDENQNQLLLDIYLKLTYISGVMYYLSSTINPLLYQLMSAKFRLAFKETFKCSLFRCAIFTRRSSSATQANATTAGAGGCLNHTATWHAPLAGNSPTNSIRGGAPPSTATLAGLEHASLCSTPLPPSQRQLLRPTGSSQVDLRALAQAAEAQPTSNGLECCCACCCCQEAGATAPAGALARLRGRLNLSLTSLLRLGANGSLPVGGSPHKLNSSCSCLVSLTTSGAHSPHGPGADKRKLLGTTTSGGVRANSAAASGGADEHEVSSAQAKKAAHAKRPAELSSLQTNFPAHHTMLKFIRSPTPSSMTAAAESIAPGLSLSRLSSREDERESASPAVRISGNSKPEAEVDEDESSELLAGGRGLQQSGASAELLRRRMGALIRPTTNSGMALTRRTASNSTPNSEDDDDDDDDDDEVGVDVDEEDENDDELMVATSTESSVNTSPEQLLNGQLGGASRTPASDRRPVKAQQRRRYQHNRGERDQEANANTNTTTTTMTATSSSSTSSLSLANSQLGSARDNCDQQQQQRHLESLRAEFGHTKRHKLAPNDCKRRHSDRSGSPPLQKLDKFDCDQ